MEEFKLNKNFVINPAHQKGLGLAEMDLGLVYACYSLPEWQAVNLLSLHPGRMIIIFYNSVY